MIADGGRIYSVRGPLEARDLKEPSHDCEVIQIQGQASDRDFELLGDFMVGYPQLWFRVYGWNTIENLRFLRFFKTHRRFQIDVWTLPSTAGHEYLADDLEEFSFGGTKRALDIAFLSRFKSLQYLYLEGKKSSLDVLTKLRSLRRLSLRSFSLDNVEFLATLDNLRDFEMRLGGCKDLSALPRIGRLRYLHLWKIKGLTDLSFVGEMVYLQNVFLQALRRVEQLPSLERCKFLRRIALVQMKGLTNIEAVATAPALRELQVSEMRQLPVEAFEPLIGKGLQRIDAWSGSARREAAIVQLLKAEPVRFLAWKPFEYS